MQCTACANANNLQNSSILKNIMIKSTVQPNNVQPNSLPSEFLIIENLSKAYPNPDGSISVVLDDISLTVRDDEFVCLIGHSGCGKSTLLKMVAGLEKATAGRVTLEGKEIRKPGADRMMVFQHYGLLPWLTVRENIRLAVDEVLGHLPKLEKAAIVTEHLSMVNLTAAANKYPDEISGGMKQRVGIVGRWQLAPKCC